MLTKQLANAENVQKPYKTAYNVIAQQNAINAQNIAS